MDFNDTLWDNAEREIQDWKTNTREAINELSGILKAIFLFNREKLRVKISQYQNISLQTLNEKGIVRESDFLYEPESRINFSFSEPRDKTEADKWDKESKKRNLKENREIVDAILLGNQLVVSKLYEDEFPKIVRLILKNSGNLENAKDIFQDGLVLLIENVLNKKIDLTESFSSYLYGICRILWLNHLKSIKKKIKFREDYSYLQAKFNFLENENPPANYENIFIFIESMGNSCKKLLEFYYYRNMSWEEIAEELGYASEGSARNQKYKCLERIRKQLAEKDEISDESK